MHLLRISCLLLIVYSSLLVVRGSSDGDAAPEPGVGEGDTSEENDLEEGHGSEGEEHDEDSEEHHPHWSYHGEYYPAKWNELFALCKAESPRQSPIDIHAASTVFEDELLAVHLNEKIDRTHTSMELVNNGHSVNVVLPHEVDISGGGLPSVGYRIAGIHFHWGSSDSLGSEHTVQQKAFPLEMHMVSYDTERYAELGDAVFGQNSLAVLGTMFQISAENNTLLDPIISGLKRVRESGSTTTINHFKVGPLLPAHTNKYFRYLGSLTTPPCAESVIWTLFVHVQTISSSQLKEFRLLLESENEEGVAPPIVDNWRPVQQLYQRVVYRSFLLKSEISKPEVAESGHENSAALNAISAYAVLTIVMAKLL